MDPLGTCVLTTRATCHHGSHSWSCQADDVNKAATARHLDSSAGCVRLSGSVEFGLGSLESTRIVEVCWAGYAFDRSTFKPRPGLRIWLRPGFLNSTPPARSLPLIKRAALCFHGLAITMSTACLTESAGLSVDTHPHRCAPANVQQLLAFPEQVRRRDIAQRAAGGLPEGRHALVAGRVPHLRTEPYL